MDRRAALRGVAGAALGAGLGRAPAVANAASNGESAYVPPKPAIDGQMLVNKPRAYDVLERFGLDGLIALDPVNVYYLTNMVPIGVKFISEYPGFATMGKDPQAPIFLVTGGTTSAWEKASGDKETAEVMPYGFGGWNEADVNSDGLPIEPTGAMTREYYFRSDIPLTEREQRWKATQERYSGNLASGAAWALARALKAQGITKGKVAVDDMRIADFLAQTDLINVECVPGYGVFQLIRMVKTEQELAYQRIGGRNNGDAGMTMLKALDPGMTFSDVEQIFRVECARRGNDVNSIIAGYPGGGFPDDGKLVAGKPFLVDAVSNFRGYMGDFARTFIIGDPPKTVLERFNANQTAREAVFDAIKPGVKYSTLRQIGYDTMVKHGMPEHAVFVTPHSVGLQHDDNPARLPQFGIDRIDHVLEENMVLTVDLPYLEVGWGCGHNEDLFRVTKTGYEVLATEEEPLVIL